MTRLAASGLTKRRGRRLVVADVSLEVDAGEIVGLLGPVGAGKTTTISLLAGLTRPDSGRVLVDGIDVTGEDVSRRARRGLGHVPRGPSVIGGMTVRENVLAVVEWTDAGRGDRARRVTDTLDDVGLDALAGVDARALEPADRRRLEVARVLASGADLLVLDRPFGELDGAGGDALAALLGALRERGLGVLVADDDVRANLVLTDRAYVIHEGRILREGTPYDLLRDEEVRRICLPRFTLPELLGPGRDTENG